MASSIFLLAGLGIIGLLILLVLAALPLYLAIKILGGRVSLLRVIGANIGVALLTFGARAFLGGAGLFFTAAITVFIYMFVFKVGPIRALAAMALTFIITLSLVALMQILGGGVIGV